jgi:aryl-alcohol dehydrogenase-like predicted oxidoreductase
MHENVSLLAYSPLAGGILTGKYQNGARPEWARYSTWWQSRMPQYVQDRVFDATAKYIALADELWISVTQLALARVNDRPFVWSNIIWATTMEQLQECISSASISLDDKTLQRIDQIHGEFFNPACF